MPQDSSSSPDPKQDPKQMRGLAKADVTRRIKRLESLVAEEDAKTLAPCTDALISSFRVLVRWQDICEPQGDDAYLDEIREKYNNVIKQAKTFLRSTKEAAANVSLRNLPPVELPTFDGQVSDYPLFISTFDDLVHKAPIDDAAKLARLLQFTKGKANHAIKSCVHAADGYVRARSILKQRFGDDYTITEEIATRLRSGSAVSTPDDIRQLADELSTAVATLKQLGTLSEMESQHFILDILRRLPTHNQLRYKKLATEEKRTHQCYPSISDFAAFVSQEADDATDPVFGQIGAKEDDCKPQPTRHAAVAETASRTAAISAQVKQPECPLCSASHKLRFCSAFRRMSPSDRLNYVNENDLCHLCMSRGHRAGVCKSSYVCDVDGCGMKHSKFLHDAQSLESNRQAAALSSVNSPASAHIPFVQVKVSDVNCIAILDTASDATFCSKRLARSLSLEGKTTSLSLNTLNGRDDSCATVVNLTAHSVDDSESLILTNVIVIDEIPFNNPVSCLDFPHLRNLKFPDAQMNADILIGQDNAEALVPLEVRKGKVGQPFAVRTLFGWSLNGPAHSKTPFPIANRISHFISSACSPCESLNENLSKWWQIECEGLSNPRSSHSIQDQRVLDYWDTECQFIDGHFQLPIPWKPDAETPNNFHVAAHRLKSTHSNLIKRDLLQRYSTEISKLLANGFCEPAPISPSGPKLWYLPHHAVLNPKKPDKVRVVFDCAARYKGESLNDKCFSGPDLINRLIPVLIRFRQHRFAFTADIEAMYYQITIPVHERDALRFLWYDDAGAIIEFRMTRHLFGGVWCASSSTYALRKCVDDLHVSADIRDAVNRSFYVDDCLRSSESQGDLRSTALGTVDALHRHGFKLTKFMSNSNELLSSLPETNKVTGNKDLGPDPHSRVLGVHWNVSSDIFIFDSSSGVDHPLTRRKMLSFICSFFDPLGLIAPMLIRGKVLLQQATREKLSWDAPVPGPIAKPWRQWQDALTHLHLLQFPRCIKPLPASDCACELHHFSDASEQAYGCCSYLRCIDAQGQIQVSLIMSKSRVAPIKQLSIPRLELEAAVLSAKIDSMLSHEVDICLNPSYFWTDSQIVLKYIQNESRRFQTYVANRVSTIHSLSDPSQWHYVPSAENVADIVSRGFNIVHEKDVWISGPPFLYTYKSSWPKRDVDGATDDDLELKKQPVSLVTVTKTHPFEALINHYSDFFRLKRAVAWLLRLVSPCRPCTQSPSPIPPLSVQEVNDAENALLKFSQQQAYPRELDRLAAGHPVSRSSSVLSLDIFLGPHGLLRLGGRLRRSAAEECMTPHPVIISHKSPLARLIALHFHNQAHLGTEWVVSQIREKYWITHARAVVKRIGSSCITCKKRFAMPMHQKMSDLPLSRIEPCSRPFTNVGVDCFGPFTVKRARSDVKRYGCIFCCFQTRAVHLELLDSLDVSSFINAFRRFIARRGSPTCIYSDNGTNFVAAQRALFRFDVSEIQRFSLMKNISWNFQTPRASHMGGVWERLIRVTRKVMTGLLPDNIRLTDESLRTLLCEAEAVINTRPITKVSESATDCAALTPNHLLVLDHLPPLPQGKFSEGDLYRCRWRCVQQLVDQFWKKWVHLYLPELQKRQKWFHASRSLKVGDLVLICDENTPRCVWPMGLISETKKSADGLVRSAEVKLKSGALLCRPVTKLVLLEIP